MERMEHMKTGITASQVKKFRIENDLTLEAIGTKAGITAATVYRIENGLVTPNERTARKLVKAWPGILKTAA